MGRLVGKTAIVTGAGRFGNIGVGVCEAFLREGARGVVATDLTVDEGDALRREMEKRHGADRFVLLRHDVTDPEDWKRVVATTVDAFGGIDVLVNNAGISIHGGVESTSLDDLRKVMAVNHDGVFLGMKYCAPALAEAVERFDGGGSIINNMSMSSFMPSNKNLGYTVSKAAGRMLTLCAATEFGPRRIRVNSIHPGLTLTPLIEEAFEDYARQGFWESREAAVDGVAAMSPLGIKSYPEDTAHAFVYFASEEARFVTGAALYHDGGLGKRF
ncbi:SDR family NAD(P)-dependent oxidoreductase [Actinocorallia populi]|uniref:SDR family NAD(P)-dependent oxidoreductase n=1 Tax=Actinocorallia populi TaxID=2079200 RepID=UPI000D0951EE|nr:SDR family oxidoreductase [Actinocorallia populi]